jgi:hypothetical protein
MQTPRKPVLKALLASTAVEPNQPVLVALLVTAALAMPCAAQEAPSTSRALPNDTCAACFAYLEFPPSLEPEAYAMRGLATEITVPSPAGGKLSARFPQQTGGAFVSSKQ